MNISDAIRLKRAVPAFVDCCAQHGTQLDFVSYHRYQDDPQYHRLITKMLSEKLDHFPGRRPELMINEWNKGFEPPWSSTAYDSVSVDEMAYQSRRAAHTAQIILTMMGLAGEGIRLDWSFYFLLWDGCMHPAEFATFFSPADAKAIMYKHWNEAPHRFGLFSENGTPRPQYFVYQILSRMGEERLSVTHSAPDLTVAAARTGGRIAVLVNNFDLQASREQAIKLCFDHLPPGAKRLTAFRIDEDHRWSPDEMELLPYEQRMVDTLDEFEYQFFSPADSVLFVTLENIHDRG